MTTTQLTPDARRVLSMIARGIAVPAGTPARRWLAVLVGWGFADHQGCITEAGRAALGPVLVPVAGPVLTPVPVAIPVTPTAADLVVLARLAAGRAAPFGSGVSLRVLYRAGLIHQGAVTAKGHALLMSTGRRAAPAARPSTTPARTATGHQAGRLVIN